LSLRPQGEVLTISDNQDFSSLAFLEMTIFQVTNTLYYPIFWSVW